MNRNRALPIVEQLLRAGKIPFICGGTNYYIESLIWKLLIDEETPLILAEGKRGGGNEDHDDRKRLKTDNVGGDGSCDEESLNEIDFENDDEAIPTVQLFNMLQKVIM